MSRVSSRFQTNTLTVWPVTAESDGYSEATYGTPFTVGCEYDQKPKVMKDDSGNEFVPEFTYYVTATLGQIERDWFCALGAFTDLTPTANAKRIRAVRAQQNIGRLGGDDITVLV
jgi:hypothetical protein